MDNSITCARGPSALRDDNRSVSEVLGYILIFALILTTIGFITAVGFPGLEDVRESEKASNAQQAYDVLDQNMAAIYERSAPSRSTEIALGDSQIYYDDPVIINVTVEGEEPIEHEVRPINLRVGDNRDLVFEGGAMIRQEPESGIMISDPPFLLSEERVHIPIVKTTAPTVESAGGTTILVRGESTAREVEYSGDETFTLNITSPRTEVWEDYFELQSFTEGECEIINDDHVECKDIDPDMLQVTLQEIEVNLIL